VTTARREGQVHLNAFLKPPGEYLAAWRHPEATPNAGVNLAHVVSLVHTAEAACFDAVFLADLVGIPLVDQEVLSRVSVVNDSFEPTTLLAALSTVTTRIGLIATASTTYNEPYHLARTFASLDHLSHGRAGWNLVTSLNDGEAQNFGLEAHLDHATRYERAAEFFDVVSGLWDSFEDDAVPRHQTSGIYFHPEKLHRLDHRGRYLKVAGPLNIARPPQGRPVVVQAGSSEAGKDLASRVADVIFTHHPYLEAGRAFYKELKDRARDHGRDPDSLKILPGLSTIVGQTDAEAKEKLDRLRGLLHPAVALSHLAYWLGGFDLSGYPLDGPLPELPLSNQSESAQHRIYELARRDNLTIRQLAQQITDEAGSIVGTPDRVADHVQTWFQEEAADGFNVIFSYLPGALEDFANGVIPELRRRGLFRTAYEHRTLRGHLELPRPESRWATG
jgi:FMN-dependent oxidoreductase (nitrilotriacetate monooxygenase family)